MTQSTNGVSRNGVPWEPDPAAILAEARRWWYERLALASAVIWVTGAAILMGTIVPYIEHPQLYIAVASVIPIVPASLPWLFYPRLARKRAERLMREAQHP